MAGATRTEGSFGLAGALRVEPLSKLVTIDCVGPQGDLTWMAAAGSVRASGPVFRVSGPQPWGLPGRASECYISASTDAVRCSRVRVMSEGRFEHAPSAQSAINRNRPEGAIHGSETRPQIPAPGTGTSTASRR